MDAVAGSEDEAAMPRHVAIIMDGNRRWASQRGLLPNEGHARGVQALFETVQAAAKLGIRILTVYGFSTENWLRSEEEVAHLMELICESIERYQDEMLVRGVRLATIGDLTYFPEPVQMRLQQIKEQTRGGGVIDLVLALNYGARDDIRRAAARMAMEVSAGRLAIEDVTEERFASFLDTASWPDPDMLIRTSGEHRLSNFLLWQLSYAEVVVTETLWPEFGRDQLLACVKVFLNRERRLGQ